MDDELIIVAAVVAGLYLLKQRRDEAAAAAEAAVHTPLPGAAPVPGAALDPADLVGTSACIVGTTAAGYPILAPGCAPVVKLVDGTLKQIPTYAYAANPTLLLVNPVVGFDKIKDGISDVGHALNPWNW